MTNINKDYDDKARLVHAFMSKIPPRGDGVFVGISVIASMFGISQRAAQDMIARGRVLVEQEMAESAK